MELARVKKENSTLKMENEILKLADLWGREVAT